MNNFEYEWEHLTEIEDCYACAAIVSYGRLYYIFASDAVGRCCAIDAETKEVSVLWDEPGGTMSIIPLAETKGEFLISQRFWPGFKAKNARILRARPVSPGKWAMETWLELPYVHRFDIIKTDGGNYFLGCTLSSTDQPQADFNVPGALVGARLDSGYNPPEKLYTFHTGMTRNHGYWRNIDSQVSYASCDEGVFSIIPPMSEGADWQVEKILDRPTSDIAFCDIDGDGKQELACIHPFHGDEYCLYRLENGAYKEFYRYPEPIDFTHVVWGGLLAGRPAFLGGYRGKSKELFALYWDNGEICRQTLAAGGGPSNVALISDETKSLVMVANHACGSADLLHIHLPQPNQA